MTGQHTQWAAWFAGPLQIKPGSTVGLPEDFDPGERFGLHGKKDGVQLLRRGQQLLTEYQRRLAGQDTHRVLVVPQAIDAGGKDGTIRHIMSGVTRRKVTVSGFNAPSAEELGHDYLRRHARQLPWHVLPGSPGSAPRSSPPP